MKDLNVVKSKIQSRAVESIIKAGGRGIIAIATGGGKSKVAIDYITVTKPEKVMLVVPTVKLRDVGWRNEFAKWGMLDVYNNIELSCYASIKKVKDGHYDLVILDELQNITELNFQFFENNSVKDIVALTATPPQEFEKRQLVKALNLQVTYEILIHDAVDMGLVAPYQLYFVEMELDNRVKYIKAGTKEKPFMTTEKKKYEYLSKRIAHGQIAGYPEGRMKWLYLERMHFIYGLQSKRNAAKYVLDKMIPPDDRTMIFAANIKLAEFLEPQTYHSKTNGKYLEDFMNGKINRLSCVKALNEGIDIKNLDTALIAQVTSKERHLVQRMGRIVRHRPNHLAKIFILYAKDTVDEEWVKKATKNIDSSNAIFKRLTSK